MQNTELPTRLQTDPNFRQPLTRREVKQKMLGLGYSGTQFRQLYRLAKDKIRNTGIFSRYGVRDAARNALYNNFPKVVHRSPDEVEGIAQQRLALQDAANKMISEIQPNSNYFSVDISKYNTAPEDISVEEVLPESAAKPVIAPRYKDGDDFTSMGKFDNAFALARKNGMKVFTWNGKKYGTKMDPNWRERWGRVKSKSSDGSNSSSVPDNSASDLGLTRKVNNWNISGILPEDFYNDLQSSLQEGIDEELAAQENAAIQDRIESFKSDLGPTMKAPAYMAYISRPYEDAFKPGWYAIDGAYPDRTNWYRGWYNGKYGDFLNNKDGSDRFFNPFPDDLQKKYKRDSWLDAFTSQRPQYDK